MSMRNALKSRQSVQRSQRQPMPQMMNSPNQATSFQPRNQQWQQNEQYQYYAQVEQQPFLPPINNQSYMTGRPPPQSQQRSRKPQPVSQTYQPNYQPQLNYGVYLPAQASRQAEQEYYASQQQFVPNYQNYAQQQPNYYPPQQAQQAYMPPQDNRVAKFRPQMAPLQTQVAPQRSRLPSKNPPELNTDPRLQSSSSRPEFYNYLSGTLETPRRRRPITSSEPPRRRMSTAERYQDNKSYSAISVSSGYTPYSYEDYLSMKSRVEQMTLPRGLGPNHPDQWQVEHDKRLRMIDYAAKVKEREALRPRSGKNRPKTGMNGMPLDRHLPTLPAIVKQAENIQQQPMVQHIRQEVNFQASNDVPIPVTNNDQHVSPKKTMGPMKAMIHHRTTEAHAR